MALRQVPVSVNLRGGVDLKTDARLVIPSKLLVATDVEFESADTFITRYGLTQRSLPTGVGYVNAVRMFEHGNVPNIEFQDGSTIRANGNTIPSDYGLNALTDEANTFARVGALTKRAQALLQKPTAPGAGLPLYDRNFDVVLGINNYCIVWEEPGYTGRMAVRWSIRSYTTDAEVYGGIFSGTVGTDVYVKPRVVFDSAVSQFIICTAHFLSGGINYDVEGSRVPEAGGALVGPTVMIAVPGGGAVEGATGLEALYDVHWHSWLAVCARQTNAAGNIYMRLLNSTLTPIVATTNAAPAIKPVSLTAHASDDGAGNIIAHAIYGAGANLRGYRLPSNTGVQSAEVTITAITGLVGRVAVRDYVAGSSLLIAFDNFTATSAIFAQTYVLTCSIAHAGTNRTQVGTNCFLSGRMFDMRGRVYMPVMFTSAQYQSVTLVLDVTNAIRNLGVGTQAQALFIARIDWGDTANPSPLALDSAHRVPTAHYAMMPYLKFETNTRLAGTVNVTAVTIALCQFDQTGQLGDAKWNGDTYLAGALPMVTDGVSMVEEGFHWNPEVVGTVVNNLVVVPPVATGTGIYDVPAAGTYILAFTESWEDAQGNWHESGVALLCSLTATAGNLGINPTIIRPPSLKRNQAKLAAGYKTGLTLYRTKGSSTDTTLYLGHSNELAAGTGYINDTDLGAGEPLYTEGGVLSNTPAPSCRHMAAFDSRMVLTGCGDGSKMYWSKTKDAGFAVEFVSDEKPFQEIIPPEFGRGVASCEMLGKLVVLCETKLGAVFGTGPNGQGQGGYQKIETIAKDIGVLWTAPKSVALATEGIWFQSPFGLRLFTGQGIARDNAAKFVGSEVDTLITTNNLPIVTLPGGNTQQTRFFAPTLCFVWDQTWGQFTIFTKHENTDAVMVNGVYFIVRTSGPTVVLQFYDKFSYSDQFAATAVIGEFQTSWLQLGGIQGYQRVYNMLLLGSGVVGGAPRFFVSPAYDGEAVGSIETDAEPLTSASGVIQFEHQFWKQKCQSMSLNVRFYDQNLSGRVRLTDLTLSVGVKAGPWKSAEVK